MTEPSDSGDTPTLDDVIEPTEHPHPDHHEHAKIPKHVSADELDERLRHEREEAAQDG